MISARSDFSRITVINLILRNARFNFVKAHIRMFKWRIGVYCGRRLRRGDWLKKSISARLNVAIARTCCAQRLAFYEGEILSMSGVVQGHRGGSDLVLSNVNTGASRSTTSAAIRLRTGEPGE